jgi:hypothetical protein
MKIALSKTKSIAQEWSPLRLIAVGIWYYHGWDFDCLLFSDEIALKTPHNPAYPARLRNPQIKKESHRNATKLQVSCACSSK